MNIGQWAFRAKAWFHVKLWVRGRLRYASAPLETSRSPSNKGQFWATREGAACRDVVPTRVFAPVVRAEPPRSPPFSRPLPTTGRNYGFVDSHRPVIGSRTATARRLLTRGALLHAVGAWAGLRADSRGARIPLPGTRPAARRIASRSPRQPIAKSPTFACDHGVGRRIPMWTAMLPMGGP
jgi:hypothetical protein